MPSAEQKRTGILCGACGWASCWSCKLEPHAPATCAMLEHWQARPADEALRAWFAAESTRGLSFARAFVLLRWCGSHLVAACSAPAASTHRIRLTRKCPKSSSTQPRALAPSALTLRARSALALLSSLCFVPHWLPTNAARKGKANSDGESARPRRIPPCAVGPFLLRARSSAAVTGVRCTLCDTCTLHGSADGLFVCVCAARRFRYNTFRVRLCSCAAKISKNGACPQMKCRMCNTDFRWQEPSHPRWQPNRATTEPTAVAQWIHHGCARRCR